MKISAAFPSRWLKAADLEGKEREVQIDSVMSETINEEDGPQPVVYFCHAKKGLVCNKTNSMVMAEAFGDETDDWSGKKVILYTVKTAYKGNPCDGLRVRIPQELVADNEDTIPF